MTSPASERARRVLVRYTVRSGLVEQNEALVRAVYDQLHQTRPEGFRYATFRLGEGSEFVHLASSEPDSGTPLTGLSAFRAFQEGLDARCEIAPVLTPLRTIGSFGLFDAG